VAGVRNERQAARAESGYQLEDNEQKGGEERPLQDLSGPLLVGVMVVVSQIASCTSILQEKRGAGGLSALIYMRRSAL